MAKEPKGRPIPVPEWWMEELHAEMKRANLKPAGVAAKLSNEDRDSSAFKAAKTRVSRFLSGEIRTQETVDDLRGLFPSLPLPVFVASTHQESLALAAASQRAAAASPALPAPAALERLERLTERIAERLGAVVHLEVDEVEKHVDAKVRQLRQKPAAAHRLPAKPASRRSGKSRP